MQQIYNLKNIDKIELNLRKGDLIFLNGDLGAGKTTLSKHILNNLLKVKEGVISPTYTYYNKYKGFLKGEEINIYHFDLYRLSNYDEFFAIGAEEIFDNNNGIILVEWPDLVKDYYKPKLEIFLEKVDDFKRKIIIKE